MRIVRFMSLCEKECYLAGGKLMNATDHAKDGMKTTSVGYCFAELARGRDADKWLRKLMFNTKAEYCIEFDTDDFSEPLTESEACYADDHDFNKIVKFREWCTISYSIKTHPYRRIGKCPSLFEITVGQRIDFNITQ